MKKVLTVLLIASLMMSVSVTAVFAAGSQNNNPGNSTSSPMQTVKPSAVPSGQAGGLLSGSAFMFQNRAEEQKMQMNQYFAQFEENRLDPDQLRTQTRAQLQTQLQLTEECKLELRLMNETYRNMTAEQREAAIDDIIALRQQIRSVQKYNLQIMLAAKDQLRLQLQDCITDGTPTEDEVAEVTEVLSEL
ncbi:MAG: hypothetical protein JXQ23_07330 [Clostridia bacterium]|nr:hypothetical protein [Clostridia bacterium]